MRLANGGIVGWERLEYFAGSFEFIIDLSERFELAKSTMSGHFNVLKHAGLVVSERSGTTIVYSLNLAAYEEALAGVMSLLGVGRKEKRA